MKRYIIAGLLTSAILFPLFGYVYMKGWNTGVETYKQSKAFQMTLDSMYRFGLYDGQASCGGKHVAH